jgi:hypothetical protein
MAAATTVASAAPAGASHAQPCAWRPTAQAGLAQQQQRALARPIPFITEHVNVGIPFAAYVAVVARVRVERGRTTKTATNTRSKHSG